MDIIINADDFGMSERHTSRIIELFEKNKITSTTFLVNTPYSDKAAALVTEKHPSFIKQIGIHLNFLDFSPLNIGLKNSPFVNESFIFQDFRKRAGTIAQLKYVKQLAKEVDMQIEKFHNCFGTYPSHIDSHGHTHCTFIMMVAIFLSGKAKKVKAIRLSRQYDHERKLKHSLRFTIRRFLKGMLNNCYRLRFATTEYFTDIRNLDGSFITLNDLNFLASKYKTIEIMAHPYYKDESEYDYLLSDNNVFATLKSDMKLIKYSQLP